MRCPTARTLITKAVREPLSAAQQQALEGHLAGCPACRDDRMEQERLEAALHRAAPVRQPEPAVRVDTRAILESRPPAASGFRWPLPVLAVGAATAAACAALLLAPRMAPRGGPGKVAVRPVNTAPVGGQESAPPPKRLVQGSAGALSPASGSDGSVGSVGSVGSNRPRTPVGRAKQAAPGAGGPAPQAGAPDNSERPLALQPPVGYTPAKRTVSVPAQQLPAPPKPALREPVVALRQEIRGEEEEPVQRTVPGLRPVLLQQSEGPQAPADPFHGDAHLEARITVDERERPLGELLPELGKRLGVRLTATRETADDKASLFFKEQPAARVLTLLARQFDFQWRKKAEGYELTQTVAAQRREDQLRRDELGPINAEIERARVMVRMPKPELKKRLDDLDAQLKAEGLDAEARESLAREKRRVLNALLGPEAIHASLALFGSLTPAETGQLLSSGELRFSTANGTLPAALAERIYATNGVLEAVNGNLARLQADATIRLTEVKDEDEVPPPRTDRSLRLQFRYTTLRGSKDDPHNWGTSWSPTEPAGGDATPPAPPLPKTDDPDLKQQVELVLPGPARQPLPIYGGGLTGAACVGAVWPRQAAIGDVARAIHAATGLEVLADGFVPARIDPGRLRGKRPLIEVLHTLATQTDYTWKKSGRLITLRSRRFYWDRPREVPERLLRPFRQRVIAEKKLTLDSLASLAAALDDAQARSMSRYWGWYLEGSGIMPTNYFFAHRQHLRLWASLNETQRKAAVAGPIPVGALNPPQQQLWLAALASPPESAAEPVAPQPALTPQELAAGGFSLRPSQAQELLFVRRHPDGTRLMGSSISVEGGPSVDPRKFMHFEGDPPDTAGPQVSLDTYAFSYYQGGRTEPARQVRVDIPPLQPAKP